MQYCKIIPLDNNSSVKFTSSRGDNSTTNDSMVMKIEQPQLHMYTNIMYEFQRSTCKTVGEKLRTKLCPWTDGRTDRQTNMKIAYAQLHIHRNIYVNFRAVLATRGPKIALITRIFEITQFFCRFQRRIYKNFFMSIQCK